MRNRLKWRAVAASLVVACIALHEGNVLAGIGVQQTVTELEASPGQEKAGIFTVANGDNESAVIKVEAEDWLKLRTGNSPIPVNEWLTIDTPEFKLEPGETKDIGYRVKVPNGVNGEVIAQVYFSGGAPSGEGMLKITTRFGVALYVGVEGTELIDPVITELKIDKTLVSVTVENRGNVHIRPSGTVIIKDKNGAISQTLNVPYTAVIYGSQAHTYTVCADKNKLSRGQYTLDANLNIGKIYGNNKEFSKTISFYYE